VLLWLFLTTVFSKRRLAVELLEGSLEKEEDINGTLKSGADICNVSLLLYSGHEEITSIIVENILLYTDEDVVDSKRTNVDMRMN